MRAKWRLGWKQFVGTTANADTRDQVHRGITLGARWPNTILLEAGSYTSRLQEADACGILLGGRGLSRAMLDAYCEKGGPWRDWTRSKFTVKFGDNGMTADGIGAGPRQICGIFCTALVAPNSPEPMCLEAGQDLP